MNKKTFYKSVVALAIPIALQNLLTALLNVFDQMMVGWLPEEIATLGLSAVLLANQIVFIFQIIIFALCNTVNIFIAQYTENGNEHLIKNRAGFTLVLILIASTICTLVCTLLPSAVIGLFNPSDSYRYMAEEFLRIVAISFIPMGLGVGVVFMLRAIKKLKGALIVNVCAVAVNVVLNYVFMFTCGMGLVGAAWGTVVSRTLETIALLVLLFVQKSSLVGKLKEMFSLDKVFAKQYFKKFIPILCNEIFWVLSTTVYIFVYDKLKGNETGAVTAAVNIAQAVDKIISVMMIGVGSAIGVVMGNVIGRGNRAEVRYYARESVIFGLITGIAIALLTFASAFFAPSIFKNVTEEAATSAKYLIMLYAVTAVLRTMSFVFVISILRSGGDTTFCMVGETLILWVISVPIVLVTGLVLKADLYTVYLVSNICEVLKCALFAWRVKSNSWIKFAMTTDGELQQKTEEIKE
jgi:putative MATE family efflux protein